MGVETMRSVVNDLAVMPSSSWASGPATRFITGKVRASLVDARTCPPTALQGGDGRNVVYLMGRVIPAQKPEVPPPARGVAGVRRWCAGV